MKTNTIKTLAVAVAMLAASSASAQSNASDAIDANKHIDEIEWGKESSSLTDAVTEDEANSPKYVYLCCRYNNQNRFLASGGCWGTEGILAYTGMRLLLVKCGQTVTTDKTGDQYFIVTRMNNVTGLSDDKTTTSGTGDCIAYLWDSQKNGYGLFLDRARNGLKVTDGTNTAFVENPTSQWIFEETTTNEDNKTISSYKIYNPSQQKYIGIDENTINLVENETYAISWYLILESSLMDILTKDENRKTYDYIEMPNVIKDGRFERNSKDVSSWKDQAAFTWFQDDDAESSSGISKNENQGAYETLRLSKKTSWGTGPLAYKQTITGLPTGFYAISCQGLYNDMNATSTNDSETNNAYLFCTVKNQDGTSTFFDQSVKLFCVNSTKKGSNDKTDKEILNETKSVNIFATNEVSRAITAGQIFASNNEYSAGDGDNYQSFIYFHVEDATDSITFGVKKTTDDGEVYVDNFRLYYIKADPAIYLNATATDPKKVDHSKYDKPTMAYLRRGFQLEKWNALCLPFNVSATAMKQAFDGGDGKLKLSKLVGVNPNQKTQIQFETINLDDEGSEGLLKDECYIIWPTKGPDVKGIETTTDADGNTTSTTAKTITFNTTLDGKVLSNQTRKGPIYYIYGVMQDQYTLERDNPQTKTYSTAGGDLTFNAYYLKPSSVPAKSYVVEGDKMWYIETGYENTGTSNYNIYATTWTLQDATSSSAAQAVMTLSVDGEEIATSDVHGLVVSPKSCGDARVYNLSGMAVGTAAQTDRLPKGIYIMNGKKFVVR